MTTERWRVSLQRRIARTVRRHRALESAVWLLKGGRLVVLDYGVQPRPRYGYDRPPHPELHALMTGQVEAYDERLREFLKLREALLEIPLHPTRNPAEPYWLNRWQPGLDCVALYGFVSLNAPRRYVEVGSGISTKFVRRAIRDQGLATSIVSIDPQPRAEVDAICDTVVRAPLEDADLAPFEALEPGDLIFMDGSHRCLMSSDVTVLFLEVLPRLPAGVLIGVHDVWLPYDYPPDFANRFYSEQYVLAVDLLARGDGERVVLPAAFVSAHPRLRTVLDPLWQDPGLRGVERHGGALWLRT